MRCLLKYAIGLSLTISVLTAYGQTKIKDLEGKWCLANDRSEYELADTLVMYQDVNHEYPNVCNFINWDIDGKKFRISKVFSCTEPGRITEKIARQTFKLSNSGKSMTLFENGKLTKRFEILKLDVSRVDRYPYEVKSLTLKRITDK